MFHGLSHVDLPVSDLARARRFWERTVGASVRREGDGFVDLDSGTIILRLLAVKQVEHPVSLRLQAPDVQAAFDALVRAGARPLYEVMRTPDLELLGSVIDPDGHTFTVWRELSEDEYGFHPELPKELTWDANAEALLKSLLVSVPALFRPLARRKVTKNAETLAQATRTVDVDTVVRGYILSNAKITRDRVRQPLIDHGFDPAAYRAEFEAD